MKDYARGFYQSRQWKKTQSAYMANQHYVCERCGEVACVVHHKTYISPRNISDPVITLDWGNLEALCMACHGQEHNTTLPTAEGLTFTADGNIAPIPPGIGRQADDGNRKGKFSIPFQ